MKFKVVILENNNQGRSDGVSRVSNAYEPTTEGGPSKKKINTRYF